MVVCHSKLGLLLEKHIKSPQVKRMNFYSEYNLSTFYDRDNSYVGRAGDRLRAKHFWGDHVGTLNWDGRVWAASRKFRGIRLVTLEEFRGGADLINEGNLGQYSRADILIHYANLESDGYCLFTKNCEHIDNHIRGLGYKSPQMGKALLVGAGALLLVAAAKK